MAISYPKHFAEVAWRKVTNGIVGAEGVLGQFRSPFLEAYEEGIPTAKLQRQSAAALALEEWHWEWFNYWDIKFKRLDLWPAYWPELVPPTDEIENYSDVELVYFRRSAVAPLIIDTALKIAYRELRIARAGQFANWRLSYIGDQAEIEAARPFEKAILAGDLTTVPPFFPGDRTMLIADPVARRT